MARFMFCIFVVFWSSISLGVPLGTVSFHADGVKISNQQIVMDIDSNEIKLLGSQMLTGGKLMGTYKVDLRRFKTDIDDRDKHMMKIMEVKRFPFAIFRLDPVLIGGTRGFTGTMDFHGVKRKIKGKISFKSSSAVATFDINTLDFKLKRAWYEIVKVAEIVNVKVSLQF